MATGQVEILRSSSTMEIDRGYVSEPMAITFPTAGGVRAHAFYYAPANRDFAGPEGERPPLIVISHDLSDLSQFDRVLVLEGARIAEAAPRPAPPASLTLVPREKGAG